MVSPRFDADQLATYPLNTKVVERTPVSVNAVDGGNNSVSNGYQLSVPNPSGASLTYDSNGNLLNDGTNSYSYDAENRMIKIAYPGTGNYSALSYDGKGRNVEIQEFSGGSSTSTKRFVWDSDKFRKFQPCEARNSSGSVIAQYFSLGETISGTDYFYTIDHLGSVREMTNSYGAVQSQYSYDSNGRTTLVQGSLAADFQYAGYYEHAPSGLNITKHRVYNSNLGRWMTRDPLEEDAGINMYAYANDSPVNFSDPSGLLVPPCEKQCTTTDCCDKWYNWCMNTGRDPECCADNSTVCYIAVGKGKSYNAAFYFDVPCRRAKKKPQTAPSANPSSASNASNQQSTNPGASPGTTPGGWPPPWLGPALAGIGAAAAITAGALESMAGTAGQAAQQAAQQLAGVL